MRFSRTFIVFVCLAATAWGQDFRATISGTVADKTGAAIVGASVRAVQRSTNEVKEAKTNGQGFYVLPFLQPSTFDLEVSASGFNKIRRENISLLVAEKLDLSFQLDVGNVTEQVTVTASAESLQTADASGGVNFDSLQTSEYPLNGRQVYMLMDLSPGVLFTQEQFGATGYSGTRGWDTSGAYVMNGGVSGSNSFSLNGAPISLTGTWQVAPNVDAIQEFKVMVNTYDSAIGRTGGGSVNTTLKSGSNQWHGTLFEFLRNQILDANYTQNNLVGAPRGKHITNQFGGTIGGAVRKDKDFVFFSFEGFRERVPFPVVANVPPMNIRDGQHFKDWNETVFDPLTQHGCTNNVGITGTCRSPYIRDPFPGDVLPASRMSAIGKKILGFYPAPNTAGLTQNLVAANSTGRYAYNQPMGRWDRVIGDKDRIYALVTFQHGQEYRNQNGILNDAASGNIFSERTSQNYIADWTRILSATAVLDVRASFGRFTSIFPDNAWSSSSLTAKDLGMTNMIHAPTSTTEFPPRFTFDQFSNIFGSGANLYTWGSEQQWNVAPTVTLSRGKKNWKVGFEFVYAMQPSGNVGRTNGQFTFDRSVTRQYPLVSINASDGSSIADLLLGQPASGFIDWNDTYYRTWQYYAGFVQNDWKIRRNVTLNLGLRYDVQVPWIERWNRANTGFDYTVKNPLSDQIIAAWNAKKATWDKGKTAAQPLYPNPPAAIYGGKTFIQPGGSRRTYNTDYADIQPRVGLAWQFARKTVLRTGGGIYHRTATQTGYTDGFSQQTTYNASPDSGLTYPGIAGAGNGAFSLVNPFPDGIISPSGRELGLLTNVGNAINFDGAQRVIPRTFQYSFGLQRDIWWGVNIDASYVGSITNKVPVPYNSDYLSYDTYLQGQKTPTSLSTSVPNPFYGIIPRTATFGASSTITVQNLSYPYPLFNGITVQTNPWGNYRYDSLQLRVQKRFGGNRAQTGALTTIFSYTFSKNFQSVNRLNNWNLNEDPVHELVSYDKPQNIAFSGVWDVPFGKNRHFFNNPNPIVDKIISGWNINWIYRYTSGIPVAGINTLFSCDSYLVDNQVHDRWFNNTTSCYKGLPSYTLRTMPDRFPWLRQMDNLNVNLAVVKDFRLPYERFTLNLRGEAFNLMNHPLYGAPTTTYTDARFGMLPVGQQNFPRLVQVSLKLRF
jgi:hypothetical protein